METDNLKVLTLDSIATLKNLIGSGGGSINLYNGYGTNTDGAVTQQFMNSTFNSVRVAIGQSANYGPSTAVASHAVAIGNNALATGLGYGDNHSVAIGYSAKAQVTGSNSATNYAVVIGGNASGSLTSGDLNRNVVIGGAASNSGAAEIVCIGGSAIVEGKAAVAIGTGADARGNGCIAIGNGTRTPSGSNNVSIGYNIVQSATYNNSVALGSYTINGRSQEVSIGNPGGSIFKTRFLANVTAGEKDTDATNVLQMREVTVGEVLYASTEASSTITLSSPVSQYEKIEVSGSWVMPYSNAATPLQILVHWHLNDQDNSRTFQLRAVDIDAENAERTEVVETWTITNATTIDLVSGAMISGSLTDPTAEVSTTPYITITKVVGYKAI